MNIKEQVIAYLTKRAHQDKDFAGASSKQMAKTISYKAKSIETQCLKMEHEGLIFRAQADEHSSPNIWQKKEGVTIGTVKTGELEMTSQTGDPPPQTETRPPEVVPLDQRAMFIDHLEKIGCTPKNAIPTIAELFFEGNIEDLSWLHHVLLKNAMGFVTGPQRALIMAWWAKTRHLPFTEEDYPVEPPAEGKARKTSGKGREDEDKPEKRLDPGMGWKIEKDRDGDWVATPGGPMNYQEAIEAAERRHLIGAYQTPRADDDGDEAAEGEGPKTARRGAKREEPLLEKMMMRFIDSMLDGNKGRDSEADARVERLQEQMAAMQAERMEERFERLEGLVAQAAGRDPWDDWEQINRMRERLGVGGPAVTDQSPAVQIIKDSSEKFDKNVSRIVGIMERVILREGDFKPEETRSSEEREHKAEQLLDTAQGRTRSRGLRVSAFGR